MLNKIQIIGRVGQEPTVKELSDKTKVANFSVATNERYTNKSGEAVEKTEWFNIVAWQNLADIVEKIIKKGDLVYIEGKIVTKEWEKDKIKHHSFEIVADSIKNLSPKDK